MSTPSNPALGGYHVPINGIEWQRKVFIGGTLDAELEVGKNMSNSESEEPNLSKSARELVEKIAETAVTQQIDFARESALSQMDAMRTFLTAFQRLTQFAMFKTTVQSGGRISIPEAERQTVGIGDGDLVQVMIFPIAEKKGEVKKNE